MTTGNPAAVNEDALKPCPFCGGEARAEQGAATAWVECSTPGCGGEQWHDTLEDATLLWNARTPPVPEGAHDELVSLFVQIRKQATTLHSDTSETMREDLRIIRALAVEGQEALARKGEVTGDNDAR
jgi:hypothetical protein